jgi:hypothetical protein
LAAKAPDDFITPEILKKFYSSRGWKIIKSETRTVKVKYFENNGQPDDHEAVGFIAKKIL